MVVLDKGHRIGGRLATRQMAGARIDYGAQFFTVRSDEFAALAGRWERQGVAREWCRGFTATPDGYPRYLGTHGMTDLADDLTQGLDVRTGARVTGLRQIGTTWSVDVQGGGERTADAVICTAPVPQTLELMDAGQVVADPSATEALTAVRYEPCLALLVVLDRPPAVPPPGGVQLTDGPIGFVADNQAKGISEVPALTLHTSAPWSAERFDDDRSAVVDDLLAEARAWLGPSTVVEVELVRWRYSRPSAIHDGRCLVASAAPAPLVCAGDAFGEAKVEGAARSGWAAADATAALLVR